MEKRLKKCTHVTVNIMVNGYKSIAHVSHIIGPTD